MLCTHVIFVTKTYSDQASCLTTLYAFYTTAVLGVIDLTSITEVQVNYILPTLLSGLKSPILDFAASSYMIVAKLMMKVKFLCLDYICLFFKYFLKLERIISILQYIIMEINFSIIYFLCYNKWL